MKVMWGKIEPFYVFSHPTVFAMAHLSITDLLTPEKESVYTVCKHFAIFKRISYVWNNLTYLIETS